MRNYFFFNLGMKKRKLLNPKGWEAYRQNLRYGQYF